MLELDFNRKPTRDDIFVVFTMLDYMQAKSRGGPISFIGDFIRGDMLAGHFGLSADTTIEEIGKAALSLDKSFLLLANPLIRR